MNMWVLRTSVRHSVDPMTGTDASLEYIYVRPHSGHAGTLARLVTPSDASPGMAFG